MRDVWRRYRAAKGVYLRANRAARAAGSVVCTAVLMTACADRTLADDAIAGDGDGAAVDGEDDAGVSGGDDDANDDSESEPWPLPAVVERLPPNGVDILVVVDNSSSMGEEQGKLSRALEELARTLVAIDGLDFRIAFVTTDNGNPWCEGGDTGTLQLSSCRSRLDAFETIAPDGKIDARAEGCLDVCTLDAINTDRPWLERIDGVANTGNLAESIACAAPQGIAGCGYEQPLEALRKALLRTQLQDDPAHGFLRPDAALAIVVLTDEADCSYHPDAGSIFDRDENPFWQGDGVPRSAVCWNAGVTCSGENPDVWAECHAQDKAVTGEETDDPSAAVLHPVQRYVEALSLADATKRPYLVDPAVAVVLVAGVPEGFEDGDVELSYPRTGPDDFVDDFGVGPGCISDHAQAAPPVRLRELAEAFPGAHGRNISSVCDVAYDPALAPIASLASGEVGPRCYPGCAADVDDSTAGVQVRCDVTQERGSPQGRVNEALPQCVGVPASIPDGASACWYAQTDALSDACQQRGANLEFEVLRAQPAPGGTTVSASCQPC